MKTFCYALIVFIIHSSFLFAQNGIQLTQTQIDKMKQDGNLPSHFKQLSGPGYNQIISPRISPALHTAMSGSVCNCLVPLDTSFHIVPFDGSGASGGPGITPYYRNDDWSSPAILLPFQFCYFGNSYNSIYINNNGNISFIAPYSTFSANGFPDPNFNMIAPFWADVDTRDSINGGLIYYKVTPSSVIIKWEQVGYFNIHSDKVNTFQLIITDGLDPIVNGGNCSFCYGDMQWTTGDASSGVSGFGGIAATTGANLGNGVDYIQFGRFDAAGITYDGAYGSNDQVDWLDSSNFIFDLCPANVPPVALDCTLDTVNMIVADTTTLDISFESPEIGQITTITVNTGSLSNVSILNNTSGNYARYQAQIVADALNIGDNFISISASDNGTPVQTRSYQRVVHIDQSTGISNAAELSFSIFPNPVTGESTVHFGNKVGGNTCFVLTDITGREILRRENVTSGFRIQKNETGSGVFIYHLIRNDQQVTGKLIVY